jgi:hypothetical protein
MLEVSVITKITAIPIPKAESSFLETPKKGHKPRKRESRKFWMKMADMAITNISPI